MADCFNEPPPTPNPKCLTSKKDFTLSSPPQKVPLHAIPRILANLGKLRLTTLVAFTSVGGYFLAPGVHEVSTLFATVVGITFCSLSANTFNQFLEYPFDSQMPRTSLRVLPLCLIKPFHAFYIGSGLGLIGSIILLAFTNNLTALLGISNIFLYSLVYTPLKRVSHFNTHVGSIVGAIPPIIGWTATCAPLDISSALLFLILCSWQFVHFNSLSWNLRKEYSMAGYHMMCLTNTLKLRRSSLLHAAIVLVVCFLLPIYGNTSDAFSITSLPINMATLYLAFKFYLNPCSATSKPLFHASLIQITAIISLLVIHYKDSAIIHTLFEKLSAISEYVN